MYQALFQVPGKYGVIPFSQLPSEADMSIIAILQMWTPRPSNGK